MSTFDNLQIKKLDKKLVDILQQIDPRINNLRSYRSKGDGLFVQSDRNEDLPLEVFGDATKNLIKYFTPIFEKKAAGKKNLSILLIDEIENRLHYTAHKKIWQKLFELCKSENVQIFATTHSREMIEAFSEVAILNGEAAYFEMSREYDTEKIFISNIKLDTLNYALNHEDTTFRGE